MTNDEERENSTASIDYRDVDWVAERLGVDRNTVYRFLKEGALPAIQLGKKWLISERRLETFLEREERHQTLRRRVISRVGVWFGRLQWEHDLSPVEFEDLGNGLVARIIEVGGDKADEEMDAGDIWVAYCPSCKQVPTVWYRQMISDEDIPPTPGVEGDLCFECEVKRIMPTLRDAVKKARSDAKKGGTPVEVEND